MTLTPVEIHNRAEAAYCIMNMDVKTRFMNDFERRRAEKVLTLLKQIMEGTA